MFGFGANARLQRKYDALQSDHTLLLVKFTHLQGEWNKLVDKINAKGGQAFLDGQRHAQLSREEIKKLISLCHPDKHGGRELAKQMTQRLLELR